MFGVNVMSEAACCAKSDSGLAVECRAIVAESNGLGRNTRHGCNRQKQSTPLAHHISVWNDRDRSSYPGPPPCPPPPIRPIFGELRAKFTHYYWAVVTQRQLRLRNSVPLSIDITSSASVNALTTGSLRNVQVKENFRQAQYRKIRGIFAQLFVYAWT